MRWAALTYVLAVVLHCFPGTLLAQVPQGMMQKGQAEFRYFGLKYYDARLFTPAGGAVEWDADIALEITYARRFTQNALVKSTMKEIARIGRPSPSAIAWNVCFQTVQRGHRYLAISKGADRVDFALNGQQTCSLRYPGIKRSFMSIFLGKNSRSRSFTKALRGE